MTNGDIFEEIAERQGIGPEDIFSGEYFVHEVTKSDSEAHAGEFYALPRVLSLPGRKRKYIQKNNGALVSELAVAVNSILGHRSIVHPYSYVYDSYVGTGSIVNRAEMNDAHVESGVFVGKYACLSMGCYVGKGSTIGEDATVGAGVEIGGRVIIGDNVRIDNNAVVGNKVKIPNRHHVAAGETIRPKKHVPDSETDFIKRKLSRAGDIAYLTYRHLLYNESPGFIKKKS